MILSQLCFPDVGFFVIPHYPLPEASVPPSTIDFVTYVVEVGHQPIFFLEIKPALHINQISSRIEADVQMRARFHSLYNLTPRLHGVSVMGQRVAFYCMDKATHHVKSQLCCAVW